MLDYLTRLLGERGLAPHGYCLLWDPALIWTHVVSDALIGLAYFSIPLVLGRFLAQRRDVEFGWVVWLFAAFIMACGVTHFMSIFVLWVPAYGIEGLIKLATAVVSVATAVVLWPLLPRAVVLPSPRQLQDANARLVAIVAERDEALAAVYRETMERERAEDMLRQAQRMDAIGQLSGGVAHDFNNLLTVVAGNVARAQRLAPSDDKVQRSLADAMEGADRAAKLTQQLLAFSRRQPLQPTPQDIGAIVHNMSEFLQRTLGVHVNLSVDVSDNLPLVVVDRSQTENAILNLALNARDAMPEGGQLMLKAYAKGTLVALDVCDTGMGMTAATQSRALEPFFTTKALGQGSGLGLSQVFGFMKQSGGNIEISRDETSFLLWPHTIPDLAQSQ